MIFLAMFGGNNGKLLSIQDVISLSVTEERPRGFTKQWIYRSLKGKEIKAGRQNFYYDNDVRIFLEK